MKDEPKKKPGLSLVIGEAKGSDEDAPESGAEEDEDYSTSADELFDALKSDDREGFREALRAVVMSCK